MNISGPLCEQLVAAFGLTGKLIFGGHGLKSLFEEITVIIHSDMSEVEMQCRLQGLLTEIISRLSVAVAETRYSDEALALKNFLDMNIDRSVSAAELSKIVFRSPDYCQKLFLREFGITPYAYQLDRKLQKAKFLLSYTKMAVGEVARAVGSPRGARAVGMACNRNPLLLVVPCHRVVGADGSLVGFGGGLELKRRLLELERVLLPLEN
jgi:O-6-methylguanine DNA methyltransferase